MNRRQYLSTTAAVAVTTISGCTDGGGSGQQPEESGEVSMNSADNFVEVDQGETIRIETTEEEQGAGGGTSVRLYDPDGNQITEYDVDDSKTHTHEVEADGEYRVVVFTGGTASYEIHVETE